MKALSGIDMTVAPGFDRIAPGGDCAPRALRGGALAALRLLLP